jgi:hypothetical protein
VSSLWHNVTKALLLPSLFHNQQLTSKLAALLTQAVFTPNQFGVKVSEFFSGKSRLATLF